MIRKENFVRLSFRLTVLALLLTSCQVGVSVPSTPENQNSDAINGALIAAQIENHQQSPLKVTDRDLDWAIDGVGYFSVLDPESFEMYFTRNGQFKQNAGGQLVTEEGFLLNPPITVPAEAKKVFLNEGGSVWFHSGDERSWANLGRLPLARFVKPEELMPHPAASGFFKSNPETGGPEFGQAAQNGFGMTFSGALEDFSLAAAPVPDLGCRNPHPQQATARALDWAVDGEGYFAFISPLTGETLLTRQAHIQVNAIGQLISEHGYYLAPAVTLPPVEGVENTDIFVRIDPDGMIWARTPEADETRLGQITLVQPKNPDGLKPMGFSRSTVYRINTDNVTAFKPGENGQATIKASTYENCGQDILNRPLSFIQTVISGGGGVPIQVGALSKTK